MRSAQKAKKYMNSISTIFVSGATFAQLRNLDNEDIETVDAAHSISNDGAVEFKLDGNVLSLQ